MSTGSRPVMGAWPKSASATTPTLAGTIEMRYVVANPGSYMWPTANRPQSTAGCPDYDEYKYGMADLPGSLAYAAGPQTRILVQLLTNDQINGEKTGIGFFQ